MAANFDFLANIDDLQPLYAHCREAENFQLVRPEQPVFNTRLTALVHYVTTLHEVIVA